MSGARPRTPDTDERFRRIDRALYNLQRRMTRPTRTVIVPTIAASAWASTGSENYIDLLYLTHIKDQPTLLVRLNAYLTVPGSADLSLYDADNAAILDTITVTATSPAPVLFEGVAYPGTDQAVRDIRLRGRVTSGEDAVIFVQPLYAFTAATPQ